MGAGTDAGYSWAKDHEATQNTVDTYAGPSESFKAGIQQYVDEQAKAQEQALQQNLQTNSETNDQEN